MANTVKAEDFKDLEKCEKLAALGTIDDCGDPHISLITTLMPADEKTMVAGQFTKGISKENMLKRPKSGFAIVSLDMKLWTGLVNWKYVKTEGEEYIKYNNMQMWRFNTYFGIEKVYYGDLVSISEKKPLDLLGTAVNAVKVLAKKRKLTPKGGETVMRPYAIKLFGGLSNPKFISYINEEGYPVVIPVIHAQAAGSGRIVLSDKPYGEQLKGLKEGMRVAVLAVSMQTESVLVKGVFSGFKNGIGYIDIDKVYNSMPPICRYIYPYQDFGKVEKF